MAVYIVGDYIREIRTRKGYTQEELSEGICTPATLSRIENGSQTPSKRKVDKILEKLGIENTGFHTYVDREEYELYKMLQEMSRNITDGNIEEVKKQIDVLENLGEKVVETERQYLLWAKSVVRRKSGGNPEEVISLLMDAIHITLPLFDGKTPLEKNLLTFDEILIINGIAIQYSKQGNISDALRLGFWLKNYMEEKIIDGKMKVAKYPAIVFDLSNWLGKVERFEDVVKVAEDGINYCVRFGNLVIMPLLIFNKACALAELNRYDEAKKYFTQSIVIFQAMNKNTKAKEAIDWCKNKYNIEI